MWMPCKNGQMKGFRYCANPEPANGGNHCEGDNAITKACNTTIEGKIKIEHVHCQVVKLESTFWIFGLNTFCCIL